MSFFAAVIISFTVLLAFSAFDLFTGIIMRSLRDISCLVLTTYESKEDS